MPVRASHTTKCIVCHFLILIFHSSRTHTSRTHFTHDKEFPRLFQNTVALEWNGYQPFISYVFGLHHRLYNVDRYNDIAQIIVIHSHNKHKNDSIYIGQIFIINYQRISSLVKCYSLSSNATNQIKQHSNSQECSTSSLKYISLKREMNKIYEPIKRP